MNFDDIIKHVEDNCYSAFFYTPVYYRKSTSYLFINPIEIIKVYKQEDVNYAFKFIHKMLKKGYSGYALINYEAGSLFEEKLAKLLPDKNNKLIQFFFFDKKQIQKFKSSKVIFSDANQVNYSISDFKLNRTRTQFLNDVKKIKYYLKEGETYQVNYTVKGSFNFSGSRSSFFQMMLFNQSARYSAFINNREELVISLSPELFFEVNGKSITSKPMKGTIQRGFNSRSDEKIADELKYSEKNRAENVMIVDLLRNDLGRICRYGSILVDDLFGIEKYESLYQMVSTVKGKLNKKMKMKDVFQNIFPCGSVTGAPKIRTMEIINEIERSDRGIYTGSIGLFTPKTIKMNVAIRTIKLDKNSGLGVMGLGSGIVWESDPEKEYEEVVLKSNFLTEPLGYFEIFETMRYENGSIKFLNEHLNRMKTAAYFFLFKFSRKRIIKFIERSTAALEINEVKKIKLLLNKWGNVKIKINDLPDISNDVNVVVSKNKISSSDRFRYFKTTNRKLYDDEYNKYLSRKFYEVLFLNEKDEVVEGSRTNIVIRVGNTWITPPLNSGALPGIYRKYFIEKYPEVEERNIKIEDLFNAEAILLTNVLRGEVKVNKVFV